MKLYLAGPMRGHDNFNHPAFHAAARDLRDAGHDVFNPAEQGDIRTHHIRDLLGADLAWITGTAEGLVMLPGWETSAGARAEAATALAVGLPAWHFAEFLLDGADAPPIGTVPLAGMS